MKNGTVWLLGIAAVDDPNIVVFEIRDPETILCVVENRHREGFQVDHIRGVV